MLSYLFISQVTKYTEPKKEILHPGFNGITRQLDTWHNKMICFNRKFKHSPFKLALQTK